MSRHCRWCGVFVSADQPLTYREVHGWAGNQHAWRAFAQLLCRSCRAAWSRPSDHNRPVQPRTPVNYRG